MSRLLLHICCAPCAITALNHMKNRFERVVCFFHNPNIHPLLEFRKRLKAVWSLAWRLRGQVEFLVDEEYGLRRFIRAVCHSGSRCRTCYALRLARTAAEARRRGFSHFATTLTTSPHQNHELIKELGERIGHAAGVEFFYLDLREHHEEGIKEARRMSLYIQNYCGCIFSEAERFGPTMREVYRGPRPKRTE